MQCAGIAKTQAYRVGRPGQARASRSGASNNQARSLTWGCCQRSRKSVSWGGMRLAAALRCRSDSPRRRPYTLRIHTQQAGANDDPCIDAFRRRRGRHLDDLLPGPGRRFSGGGGSKIDTEGSVLGQLILQRLENGGIDVENRLQLGTTSIVREALTAGEIDLYPEYTGNGAFFFDMADSPVWKDAEQAYQTVKAEDRERNGLVWLTPAEANNTWAISVRGEVAREHDLASLEDLANYLDEGGDVKLAASAEFVESPQALPAFQKAYGFDLSDDQLLVLSGGNTAATMRAAAQQTSGVNAAMTYGTDGGLKALDLVVMDDTLGVQPVYQPTPVVRESVLQAHPEIETLLAPVFEALDRDTLQRLNGDVAVDGLDPARWRPTSSTAWIAEVGRAQGCGAAKHCPGQFVPGHPGRLAGARCSECGA